MEAPVLSIPRGSWDPPLERVGSRFGYLVVSGIFLRRVALETGTSVELLGKGDCLMPWREEPASFSIAAWEAIEPGRLAVIDLRPGSPLSRRPEMTALVAGRAVDRSRRLAVQAAIMSMVGIEERLHALLWALAERWGTVAPEGVRLEIALSQETLGELVGARRPTVSMALGQLGEEGLVKTLGPGTWLLRGRPPEAVSGS